MTAYATVKDRRFLQLRLDALTAEQRAAILRDHLDDQQIVDLTAVIGAYVTTAMLLAVGEEPTSDGSASLPPLDP